MLSSKLSRIRLSSSRIPSVRCVKRSDQILSPEKLKGLTLQRGKSTLIPPLDQTQLVSEKDSLSREILSYDQIRHIISKSKLLSKKDSPFKPVLLRFLEIELLRISSEQFENFDQFYDLFYDLMKILRKNRELQSYIGSNLSNDSFVTFNMLMNPKYYSLFMNRETELTFKRDDLSTEQKLQRSQSILKVSYEIKQQFIRKQIQNHQHLTITSQNQKSIMNSLQREQYLEYFVKFIELDLEIITSRHLKQLRHHLLHGTQAEQQVYEFQALQTIEDEDTKNALKVKFLTLYSYEMIRSIVVKYIQANDHDTVDFYMEFLMAKYSITRELPDVDSRKLTQDLYEVITYHIVKLKHYTSAVELLETMHANGLELTPKLMHILSVSFRGRKMFDATLVILKKIAELFSDETKGVDETFKNLIITELLITIREQFPGEPKIFISQFLSMFEGSELMLNELGIISLIHSGVIKKLNDIERVLPHFYKAEISDLFKAKVFPDMINITETYIAILNYVSVHQFTLPKDYILQELFNLLIDHISKVQELDLPQHPFSKENLDDGVLNVFVKRALATTENADLAISILKKALQTCTFKRFYGESVSRIIGRSENADSTEVDQLLALLHEFNIPLSFHVLSALCLRADKYDEMEQAHHWYTKILELNEPLTHFRIIQLASKNGWEFPKTFDQSLLEKEYTASSERQKHFSERVITDDTEFSELLSSSLNKFEKKSST